MVNDKKSSTVLRIVIVLLIVWGIWFFFFINNSSDSTNGEVRCWYCSKVIYNNGRAIHCTHKNLNTYTCDYCGKSNVIK